MKKKTFALLLSICMTMTVTLSACSGADTGQTSDTQEAADTETAEADDANDPSDSDDADTEDTAFEIGELTGEATDYSDESHWVHLPESTDKEVDTFYVYPTVVLEVDDESGDVPLDDETLRQFAPALYEEQATVFEKSTNVYAPYYREKSLESLTSNDKYDMEQALYDGVQRTDVYAALDYYFDNYNEGRPFILAAHSQGSIVVKIILKEYMQAHPDYYERMVAAYPIGFSFTEDDFAENPHMKFATGEDDTGVIISWNTEGPDNKDAESCVILDGAKCINPLNWKTDDTYASAEENAGSRLDTDGDGVYEDIIPSPADAQVNPDRPGSLLTTYTDLEPSFPQVFGPQSFHARDYDLFYYNLQDNVQKRIDAYMAAQ